MQQSISSFYLFSIKPIHLSFTYQTYPTGYFLITARCGNILIVKTLARLNNKDPLLERLGTNLTVTTNIRTIVETIGEED